MNLTNRYNLPDALCKAVSWNPQEGKGEWQAQLNIYKWLYEQNKK